MTHAESLAAEACGLQTPIAHRLGKALEQLHALFPAEARIGDGLAIRQRLAWHQVLAPRDQVALHHQSDDSSLAAFELLGNVLDHADLVLVFLLAVRVARIDHQALGQFIARQLLAGGFDTGGIEVRLATAAQDDVAVLVALGRNDGRVAALGNREEMMCLLRRSDRFRGNAHVAIGPVLESHRHERPLASSRCTWLSVVRAPIAPHATKSAMYCGVIMSRYSQPAGRPAALISINSSRATRSP